MTFFPSSRPNKDHPDETAIMGVSPRPGSSASSVSGKSKSKKLPESLKFCNEILRELFGKKHSAYAWPFYKPVDAVALGLHDYHDIIKTPMDLGTVKAKLDRRDYADADEFAADVRQIFKNCYTYNPPTHDVVSMAKKLEGVFNNRFKNLPSDDVEPPQVAVMPPTPAAIPSPSIAISRPPRAAAQHPRVPPFKADDSDSDSDTTRHKADWNQRLLQVSGDQKKASKESILL